MIDFNGQNRPWTNIQQYLSEKFNVVGEIDLCVASLDPVAMHEQLAKLKKDKFEINDRILIHHYDVDVYYAKNTVGFVLYNFLHSLQALDISPSVCILMTNHYGLQNEIKKFYGEYFPRHDVLNDNIQVVEHHYTKLISTPSITDKDIAIESIDYPYVCLSGAQRSHRVMFLCLLKNDGILDQGIVSWHFAKTKTHKSTINSASQNLENFSYKFVTTTPPARSLDWNISDSLHDKIWQAQHEYFNSSFRHALVDGNPNDHDTRFNIPAVSAAFLYVSLETMFDYPYAYFTEKTFRPILQKRPFVVVGAPGILKQLQKLGFRTFGDFWNEDYDLMHDSTDRLDAVYDIVKKISSMPVDKLKQLCYSMESILEYNFDFYKNNYSKKQVNILLENLK